MPLNGLEERATRTNAVEAEGISLAALENQAF